MEVDVLPAQSVRGKNKIKAEIGLAAPSPKCFEHPMPQGHQCLIRAARQIAICCAIFITAGSMISCKKVTVPVPVAEPVEENLTIKPRALQAEVTSLESAATAEFKALQERQSKLAGAPPAETDAFQQEAERYKTNCETLKRRQDEVR